MTNIWKEETINALKELGGIAHLNIIFEKLIERGNIDFSKSKTPKRTLSRVLQTYSQSTNYGIDNTFYCVYGVDAHKGVWGLVDFQIENMKLSLTSEDETYFTEGKEVLRKHILRERNQSLIKIAKQNFKKNIMEKYFVKFVDLIFLKHMEN